jgi:hypothetical protein
MVSMKRGQSTVLLSSALIACVFALAFAQAANASPAWKIGSLTLSGSEPARAEATAGTLTFPGLTTTCDFPFEMTIWNTSGTAKGEVKAFPLTNCTTNGACTVEEAAAEKLPWPLRGTTVKSNNYVIFEGIRFSLLYEGPLCVLAETVVTFQGSAGGLFNNLSHSFTFSSSSFATTGTKISVFGTAVEWNGFFPAEATGANAGLGLEL